MTTAEHVWVCELPVPHKGDIVDFIAAGGTLEQLREIAESADYITRDDLPARAEQWGLPQAETAVREPEPPQTPEAAPADPSGRIRSIGDVPRLAAFAAQKIEFAIDGAVPVGVVMLFTGEPGSGKSTVVTAACAHVANGVSEFAGMTVNEQRPVLVLDRENPLGVVIERNQRLGIQDSDSLVYWGGWCPEEAPDVFSPVVIEWIHSCERKPIIILDSFSAFFKGNENDSSEVRAFFHQCRLVANMGATVIVLHHSGKGESSRDYRGSSDIKAAVDIAYNVANLGDPSELSLVRLKAFKARITVQNEILLTYRDGIFSQCRESTRTSEYDGLAVLLRSHPGIRTADFEALAIGQGYARKQARDFLDRGVTSGRIERAKGQHGAKYHTWTGDDK